MTIGGTVKHLRLGILAACLTTANAFAGAILYVSNFGNNTITSYDAATGASLGTITGGPELSGANGVRVGRDGAIYTVGQFSNTPVRYNANTGSLINVLDPSNAAGADSAQGLVFGPDGKLYLASAANDKILRYDPVTGASLGTFATLGNPAHDGPIDIAFAPDGYIYVTAFDSGRLIKLDAAGNVVDAFAGPAGYGLGTVAIGPDGNIYVGAIQLSDFTGAVLRYTPAGSLSTFIANGTGGLVSPGGIGFDLSGNLLVANILADANFVDIGSTVLKFNGTTGAFISELVGPGRGIDTPFFLTVTATPEPATYGVMSFGLGCLVLLYRRRSTTK